MLTTPKVKSGTLTPGEPKEVTVTIASFGTGNSFGVLNRSGEGIIWVRTDGGTPGVEEDDSYPVMSYREFDGKEGCTSVTVTMISDQALDYTVEGGDPR